MKEQEAIKDIQTLSCLCKFGGDCMSCNICYKAVPMAIEALEKQIPKKVESIEKSYVLQGYDCKDAYYYCPSCKCCFGAVFYVEENAKTKKTKHCPECGQALDWKVKA